MFNPQPKPEPRQRKSRGFIKQVSLKRKTENDEYLRRRRIFLAKNPFCAVTGNRATEVHHMKGREGGLLLDERYWLAVSREGHVEIENNPVWAKEMGYSLNRL